jgi:gliding motility-associated-like protein
MNIGKKLLGSYLAVIISWLCGVAYAQTSFKPCFSAEAVKGCAPFTVKMVDCSGAPAALVFYDYGKGVQPDKQFTFTEPGKYNITQYINSGGGGGAKSDGNFTIEVFKAVAPAFEVRYCENFQVEVNITDTNYAEYLIEYGNGKQETAKAGERKTHTYADATERTIRVSPYFGEKNGAGCLSTSKTVKPESVFRQAKFSQLTVLASGQVELKFELPSPTTYNILQTNDFSGDIKRFPVSGTQNTFVSSVRVSDFDNYRFRINATNPCSSQEGASEVVLGAFLLKLFPEQNKNTLTWNEPIHAGFVNYQLFRNNQLVATFNQLSQTRYVDTDLVCGQEYCYRLEANFYGGVAKSVSVSRCMTTAKEARLPDITGNLFGTVRNNEHIVLNLPAMPQGVRIKNILLYRSSNGGAPTTLNIPAGTTAYTDSLVNPDKTPYCYQLSYTDVCGNIAKPLQAFCPVFLKLTRDPDLVKLQWNRPDNRQYEFTVEILDLNGQILSRIPAKDALDATLPKRGLNAQTTLFRIAATLTDASGASAVSYSNTVKVVVDPQIVFPTAFSPNDDGLNDTFKVTFLSFADLDQLRIYNRWGTVIFSTNDLSQEWNGTVDQQPAPAGTYVVVAEFTDTLGKKVVQKSLLNLIR